MRPTITTIFLWSFIFSFFCRNEVQAQAMRGKLSFKHLKENHLLSNLNITDIFQDSKGFLWVGTYDGLNRFDGYTFKVYRNIAGDTASLFKNEIYTMYEDSQSTLWVSTLNSGFHYYDRDRDAFIRVPQYSQKDCQVLSIVENENKLWIGGVYSSKAFIASLDLNTGLWESFPDFKDKDLVTSILPDSENELWVGTRFSGLYKWSTSEGILAHYENKTSSKNQLPGNKIQDIVKDEKNNLWIGTLENGLTKFNIENGTFTHFNTESSTTQTNLHSNAVKDLCIDEQYLWIATESGGGLSRIDLNTELLTNYSYDKNDPNSIVNNAIWSLYEDQQGRLWLGSFAKGMCVLDPLDDKMQVLDYKLNNDLVNAIYQDSKDRIWIGTEDGLVLKDKNQTHRFLHDPHDENSLASNAVLCLYEDKKSQIWVGLWNGGVNRYNEETRTFIRYNYMPGQDESISSPHVFSIKESHKTGELLMATFSGLNILKDAEKGIFDHPYQYIYERDQLQLAVLEDSKQRVWVGAQSGLSLHSLEDHTIQPVSLSNDTTKVKEVVNCIYEDSKGTLWIGSNGGLHELIDQNRFITYTTASHMPVNVVHGIEEDSKGHLWLTTTKGLTVFDQTTKTFRNFDESDGLNSNELRRNSLFRNRYGKILVGGEGINTFHPDSMGINPFEPSVYITDLKIFNQSVVPHGKYGVLQKNISETNEIFLNHTHTSFSIHYVGINFTASYKNQYAFQLEGFDDQWVDIGTQRFTTYTNLDPGTYTFRVKASNNDGLWNESGASLIIHVLPPWWKTWWAYSLLAILLLLMVYAVVRLRTTYLISQKKLLKRLVEERTMELKTKNDHIVMQAEELQAFNDSLNAMNENLEKKVKERTQELIVRNDKLTNYAFFNAHNLRAPVANIKGILQLFEEPKSIHEALELVNILKGQSENLDQILIDIQRMLEKDELIKQEKQKG